MKTIETKKIVTVTAKGQITLPAKWRARVNAKQVLLSSRGDTIEISPVRIEDTPKENTVFDAIRDNKGKGIHAKDLVKILDSLEK